MAKYNIREKKINPANVAYRNSVSHDFVEETARKILYRLMIEQKYRDPKYSAKQLSEDIQVNMRYISAVINVRFQQNYSQLVSRMRVYEAKYMLQDRGFDNMTVEDIAINVGFTTRQSFYAAFFRLCGTTPKEYRVEHGFIPKADQPTEPKPKKPKAKKTTKKKTKKTAAKRKSRKQAK